MGTLTPFDLYQRYLKIYIGWIKEGLIDLNVEERGVVAFDTWCGADEVFINMFGFGPVRFTETGSCSDMHQACDEMGRALDSGRLDLSWMETEYGLTLFKAKLIQMGETGEK